MKYNCEYCGREIETQQCPYCGAINNISGTQETEQKQEEYAKKPLWSEGLPPAHSMQPDKNSVGKKVLKITIASVIMVFAAGLVFVCIVFASFYNWGRQQKEKEALLNKYERDWDPVEPDQHIEDLSVSEEANAIINWVRDSSKDSGNAEDIKYNYFEGENCYSISSSTVIDMSENVEVCIVTLNAGEEVNMTMTMPCKYSDIEQFLSKQDLDYRTAELASHKDKFFVSRDYIFGVTVFNNTKAPLKCADCIVDEVYIYSPDKCRSITINGVEILDNVEALMKTYGAPSSMCVMDNYAYFSYDTNEFGRLRIEYDSSLSKIQNISFQHNQGKRAGW